MGQTCGAVVRQAVIVFCREVEIVMGSMKQFDVSGSLPVVLVAEDDDGIRETLSRFLSMNNYRVIEARDGLEAVSCFNDNHGSIRACLVDLNMPELDGNSCINKIREQSEDVPIFLMTGEDEDDELPKTLTDIIAKRFTKPFDWVMLVDDIGKVLEEKKI